MAETPLSSQIYLSRETIRTQISDLVKSYLELENVDLTKSSFLSFMIDIISTLTGNLLFYQLSTYKEFFLTQAQLPSSILNLSAFLGYNTQEANYATTEVLLTVPLTFQDPTAVFEIPSGFKFKADEGVEFITYYDTTVTVIGNSTATVVVEEGTKTYILPVTINSSGLNFVLPVRQLKIVEQEFQVDEDLQEFQFITIDVPIDGKVSTLTVEIKDVGSPSYTQWTEFSSLYLMTNTDFGYVSRRTDSGRRLFFGNDLIGVQPPPGGTVRVIAGVTEGADGNVISGSIRSGDRIYTTTLAGLTQVVNYEVINASPAAGGTDEESIDEIRSNAIASLTSLNRLVTEDDYKNINVIIPDSPFAANSLPVLKRSDIKVNEIQIYTNLLFGSNTEPVDNLVLTRNAALDFPLTTTYIPKNTQVTIGDYDYYTMFDLDVQLLNSVAEYSYVVDSLELSPSLQTSYSLAYDIFVTQLTVKKISNVIEFRLKYQSTESDSDQASCELQLTDLGSVKDMTNDSTSLEFVYVFDPYTDFPLNEQNILFRIKSPSATLVADYVTVATIRKDLKTFMLSNISTDGTTLTIYDVPVIEKNYYDALDKEGFETQVLQNVVSTIDLTSKKMLTDFTNVKFTNTFGNMQNMVLNKPTISPVIDFVASLPPSNISDRYILTEGTYKDYVATCTDASASIFVYTQPLLDTIVYVTNLNEKYIYSESGWITIPTHDIPLKIEVEVFRSSDYSGTFTELSDAVRTAIYEAFKSRFGANARLYRSEIIDVIQDVDGVDHCRVVKPVTSIFFDFVLEELTEQELLEYGPEFVYFKESDITVRVA